MNNRKARLPEIIDILNNHVVSSQEELSKQLALRGHTITQATLSRDLKILKANKVPDDLGNYRYIVGESGTFVRRPSRRAAGLTAHNHTAVLSIAVSGTLVIIKTRNGYASGLAYDIDMLESELLLGTIPGADTVFVAVKEGTSRDALFTLFSSILPASVMAQAKPMFLQ
ncbi:MAG: hypothetical protein K2L62_00815 [Muribaculaceae bacterium]|nr:hypothetical protein [Muribaculaceae bacterium]